MVCRLSRKNLEYLTLGILMIYMPLNIFYLLTIALVDNIKVSENREEVTHKTGLKILDSSGIHYTYIQQMEYPKFQALK